MKKKQELRLINLVIDKNGYFFGLDKTGRLWKYEAFKDKLWHKIPMKSRV